MVSILDRVNSPADLKMLSRDELLVYTDELRAFIIETILEQGGHFAANLGTIELATALHYIFNSPNDKLIWDVGHQAYPHKVICGRRDQLKTIRKHNGISGFPSISESIHDSFGTGHSSTAISAALGMATAFKMQNKPDTAIAIVGDGALSGGMVYEALNNAGISGTNLLVIINDNNIGIDPNAGALNHFLSSLYQGENNFFTDLGFEYQGPVDGHNLTELLNAFSESAKKNIPRIIHVKTIKGKGYEPAEQQQTFYHSTSKYVKVDSPEQKKESETGTKFQDVFGETLVEMAAADPLITGVTPAMPTGSSMIMALQAFPDRFFDVGIAEQHAVTFSAGLATQGFTVFCSLYSTFLQRAIDQIIHDVALQNLPVIFCIDRAGLVGEDGSTHHGSFDIALLRCIPNVIIASPKDEAELRNLMYTAASHKKGPFFIRYPKGKGPGSDWKKPITNLQFGKAIEIRPAADIVILSTGVMSNFSIDINDQHLGHYHFPFIKPLDKECLQLVASKAKAIITLEDGTKNGGFGSAVAETLAELNYSGKLKILGLPDQFTEHGENKTLYKNIGLDKEGIQKAISEIKLDLI